MNGEVCDFSFDTNERFMFCQNISYSQNLVLDQTIIIIIIVIVWKHYLCTSFRQSSYQRVQDGSCFHVRPKTSNQSDLGRLLQCSLGSLLLARFSNVAIVKGFTKRGYYLQALTYVSECNMYECDIWENHFRAVERSLGPWAKSVGVKFIPMCEFLMPFGVGGCRPDHYKWHSAWNGISFTAYK